MEKITLSLQFHFDDLMRIIYDESQDVRDYFQLREKHDQRTYDHFLSISGWWSDDLYSWLSQSLIKYQKTGKASKKLKNFIINEITRLKENKNKLEIQNEKIGNIDNNTRGFIYILKSKNLYKIGRAKYPNDRIKTYTTENPFGIKIILLKEVKNYIQTEVDLLKKFKDKHFKGEWFKLNENDVREIKDILKNYEEKS